jgi:excisionase family DNA binding protein
MSRDRLLTIAEVAERLNTTDRFPRRLVAERRIRYVKIGTHVRIPESALRELIKSNTIEPHTKITYLTKESRHG